MLFYLFLISSKKKISIRLYHICQNCMEARTITNRLLVRGGVHPEHVTKQTISLKFTPLGS